MNELLILCFFTTLLVPVIVIIAGIFLDKKTPKKINHILGYRTVTSMKNPDTWNFGNKYCGKLWQKMGTVMLIVSLILVLIASILGENVLLCCVSLIITIQVVAIILSIFIVEKALKEKFDENGEPIS